MTDPIESGGEIAPVTAARRIETLDTIRGVALFGILLINIVGFGLPDAYVDPSNSGGSEDAPLYAWLVAFGLIHAYVMQTVICLFVFSGLGLYGQLQRYELYVVVAAICLLQLLVSPIWLRRYRFGPLEWLWRSLAYRRKQPMKR